MQSKLGTPRVGRFSWLQPIDAAAAACQWCWLLVLARVAPRSWQLVVVARRCQPGGGQCQPSGSQPGGMYSAPRRRLRILLLLLALALLQGATPLLFAPRSLGLWDQTGRLAPDGSWRIWYDAYPSHGSGGLIGFGLATSTDGIHWLDEGMTMLPFDEHNCGSGAVWQSPSDPDEWVINYSDGCNTSNCSGQQIRFETSRNSSLRGPWAPRPDVPPFLPNKSLGYSGFRWDTINPYYDAETKTLYGWWTAGLPTDGAGPPASPSSPGLAGRSAMGFGKSADGLHWEALPPAILTWPNNADVTAAGFEIGGVVPIVTGGERRWCAVFRVKERSFAKTGSGQPQWENWKENRQRAFSQVCFGLHVSPGAARRDRWQGRLFHLRRCGAGRSVRAREDQQRNHRLGSARSQPGVHLLPPILSRP